MVPMVKLAYCQNLRFLLLTWLINETLAGVPSLTCLCVEQHQSLLKGTGFSIGVC